MSFFRHYILDDPRIFEDGEVFMQFRLTYEGPLYGAA
ncbi:MAG: hypothetical protein HW386_1515, partial [Gammaproteobacteria bacterium]|nr:hypothetical protein [Gammaproteobacteria bacterium]